MAFIEERVNNLEYLVSQTQLMIQGLTVELKREMREFHLHNQRSLEEFKLHTQSTIDGLSKEIKDFKTHTQSTTDSLSKNLDKLGERMSKKWEELVKKHGTLVEDMVVPNIKHIGEKYFNCKEIDCESFAIRFEKKHSKISGNKKEFDVIAVYPDKVIVNETKSNPKPESAVDFIDFIKSGEFFNYFPEYGGKELIPIFASFNIPENVLKKLSKNNIYAMGIKEDTMDILNAEIIQ